MAGERDVVERLIGWLRRQGDCRPDPGLSVAELDHAERVLRDPLTAA
ncbi:MAG: hypothetical protein M3Z25_01245 [Actinomycetota bacterium]|nr:hypothetical protein [Actinomycetota bacterium]